MALKFQRFAITAILYLLEISISFSVVRPSIQDIATNVRDAWYVTSLVEYVLGMHCMWSFTVIITVKSTFRQQFVTHYNDVIMTTMESQITSLTVVYSTVYSDADQRKHQSSVSLAFVWGIHRSRWIPRTKGQLRGKCFHLMTSSWY